MENGLFSGKSAGLNSGDPSIKHRFTTPCRGRLQPMAILGQRPVRSLSTFYSGVRPFRLKPDEKQGAIILGIGATTASLGRTFYEVS